MGFCYKGDTFDTFDVGAGDRHGLCGHDSEYYRLSQPLPDDRALRLSSDTVLLTVDPATGVGQQIGVLSITDEVDRLELGIGTVEDLAPW